MNTEFKVGDLVRVVTIVSNDSKIHFGKTFIIGSLKSTSGSSLPNFINQYLDPITKEPLDYGGGIWFRSVELVEEIARKEHYEIY